MGYHVHLTLDAIKNIRQCSNYYQGVSKKLKDKFVLEIFTVIDGLEIVPEIHMVRYKNIRIAHTPSFPFGIHFNILDHEVYVLNVFHHRQFY